MGCRNAIGPDAAPSPATPQAALRICSTSRTVRSVVLSHVFSWVSCVEPVNDVDHADTPLGHGWLTPIQPRIGAFAEHYRCEQPGDADVLERIARPVGGDPLKNLVTAGAVIEAALPACPGGVTGVVAAGSSDVLVPACLKMPMVRLPRWP